MTRQVFVSYAHEDDSFIKQLKKEVKKNGFDVWVDTALLAGQHWRIEIDNAIKASFAFILVLTPDSYDSQYVTYEWSFALGLGKYIIPILLEESEKHPRIETMQHLDFRKYNFNWEQLITTLQMLSNKLDEAGEERIPYFVSKAVEDLEHENSQIRERALQRLTTSDHPSALQAIVDAMSHHLNDVRTYAGIKLAEKSEFKDERAIKGLSDVKRNTLYWDRCLFSLARINSLNSVKKLIDFCEGNNEPTEKIEGKIKFWVEKFEIIKNTDLISLFIETAHNTQEIHLKYVCFYMLGNLQSNQAFEILVKQISQPNNGVIEIALIRSLIQYGELGIQALIKNATYIEDLQSLLEYTILTSTTPENIKFWSKFLVDQNDLRLQICLLKTVGRHPEISIPLAKHVLGIYEPFDGEIPHNIMLKALKRTGTPEALDLLKDFDE